MNAVLENHSGKVKNKLISKIHNVFTELRDEAATFYGNTDQSLIRFTFGEGPTFWQFKVKFSNSHKSIKFVVSKEGDQDTIEFTQYEKTMNIILDIDEIHRVRHRDYIEASANLKDRLQKLYLWGIRVSRGRKNEVFKAQAIRLPTEDNRGTMHNKALYYGIVINHEVLGWAGENPSDGRVVRFNLLGGNSFTTTCSEMFIETIQPNRILVVNWLGRFNLLSFSSVKHHLTFTEEQYSEVTRFLNTQKDDQDD